MPLSTTDRQANATQYHWSVVECLGFESALTQDELAKLTFPYCRFCSQTLVYSCYPYCHPFLLLFPQISRIQLAVTYCAGWPCDVVGVCDIEIPRNRAGKKTKAFLCTGGRRWVTRDKIQEGERSFGMQKVLGRKESVLAGTRRGLSILGCRYLQVGIG